MSKCSIGILMHFIGIFSLEEHLPNQLIEVDVSDIADVIVKVMGLKEPLQTNSQQAQRENRQNKETVDVWDQRS